MDQPEIPTPALTAMLTATFLLTVAAVPLAQSALEMKAGLRPGCLDVEALLPDFDHPTDGTFLGKALGWLPRSEELQAYEEKLETESFLRDTVVPVAQVPLVRLGAGNEQVYLGRDGWLFYREDVDHVTGKAFLAADRGNKSDSGPGDSGPVGALVDLSRQLLSRGCDLLVVPVPVKPSVHPEKLSRRYTGTVELVRNPSFDSFVEELSAAGVSVLDLAPALMRTKAPDKPLYLATDTHWLPETVRVAAAEIGDWIRHAHPDLGVGSTTAAPAMSLLRLAVTNLGDTARMLKLPPDSPLYPREAAVLRTVGPLQATARPAPILFLGDSFSNIYSLPGMGWGQDAGLAEHLRHELGQPVESITRNDGGALALRVALARRVARDQSLFPATQLVIYQFAARELSQGDWRAIKLP